MCGKNCGQKLKKIGLLLLLFLLVCSPSYSVEIDSQDWEIVSNYVLTSETVLPELSSQLKTVNLKLEQSQTDLMNCQTKVSQLQISLESMEQEIQTLTKSNNRLKIVTSIGLTVGVLGVATGLVVLLLN